MELQMRYSVSPLCHTGATNYKEDAEQLHDFLDMLDM